MKKYLLSLVLLFFSSSVFAIAVQDIPKRVYDDATESYKVKIVSSVPTASDTAGLATEAKQDAAINLLTSLDNKYGNEVKIISIKSFSNSVFAETSSFNSTSFIGFDLGDTFQKITIATDTNIIWNATGSGAGSLVFANSIDVENIEVKTVYVKLKNAGIGYITIRGVKE